MTPVLILAGGKGRRIGGGKPEHRLGGERLIDRAIRTASAWSDRIAIAARSVDQIGSLAVPILEDDMELEGPLAGLAAGLGWARSLGASSLLTIPCDTPFLPDDLLIRLGEALASEAMVAIAASDGMFHPASALWRVEALDALPGWKREGGRSLWGFARAIGSVAVEWPASPHDPFLNVNTPQDLARAELLLEH